MFDRPGCRKNICDFLSTVDLASLVNAVPDTLDQWTNELTKKTGFWGPSRKAINLFLRDAAYNHWTRTYYGFDRFEHELEVPLDGIVMKKLSEKKKNGDFPRPPTVKNLTPEKSACFQRIANDIASDEKVWRIHLDLTFWNGGIAGRI